MKFGIAVGVSLMLAGGALAQHYGGHRTFGSRSGFGNILFPGTGSPPPLRNPLMQPFTSFAHRLGSTVGGGYGPALTHRFPRNYYATPYYSAPYVVPVYTGGYYTGYAGYAPAPPQPPQEVTVTVQNPAAQQPPVIINQYFGTSGPQGVETQPGATDSNSATSGLRHYQAPIPSFKPPEPAEDAEPTVYLIAYKNHSIYPALGYWMEDDTLHYITLEGSHNRASLELIDVEMSNRLNRERDIDFRLPLRD